MSKKRLAAITAVSLFAFSSIAYAQAQNDKELLRQAKAFFAPLPDKIPAPATNPITPEKVKLGKKLYFEKRLSLNNTMSCNTCHNLKTFGVDNEATSKGVKGQRGGRNSPTVFNAGFHLAQFWDGRAKDLEEQAGGPILNPVEMAMPNEAEVLKRLKADKQYTKDFAAAFKGEKDPVTYKNLAKAIATFERTLVTPSKFDDFLKGNTNALTLKEKQGLRTFIGKGCTTCHNGVAVGGQMYQKLGLVKPYKNQKDKGRFDVTKKDADKMVFKVPSLRNIAKTAPYFHDGSAKDLKTAIKTMGEIQLGIPVSDKEADEIAAFLNTLTGKTPKID